MSSELFLFDNSFFSDPFSPFTDSAIDDHLHILQSPPLPNSFHESNPFLPEIQHNPVENLENPSSLNQFSSILLSSSPPSHQLENLSLSQTTHFSNGCFSESANEYAELPCLEIKTEECNIPFDSSFAYSNSFVNQGCVNLSTNKSYNYSNCFHKKNQNYSLLESPNFHSQVVSSPESSLSSSQMRRVCSTGDLLNMKTTPTRNVLSSSPLSRERSFIEDAINNKVGRYSAEERKERIDRYRAKRTQRNFNKTIKYACRKTLADNRPRVRGRFARNDEALEIPKSFRCSDEEDLWVDGFQEEDEVGLVVGSAPSFNIFNVTSFQYFNY